MTVEAPAVAYLNDLIKNAINARASDIHIEPNKDSARVRFRIDGCMHDQNKITSDLSLQVISRVKVLSAINVEQRRIPQDGKLIFKAANAQLDMRIATFPTVFGEKLVVRLFDTCQIAPDLYALGLNNKMLNKLLAISRQSTGFFLVTGPTGSGKTTTLHSMLSIAATPDKNVVTLEDPIEYQVCGITQSQIAPEIGFTFERGIRSLLRQDPDVIMVGEIRDRETAQTAIQASLTGHLLFSTLHTANACAALMRLIDMGIEPFLINATVTGILAQRLVRVLCQNCKFSYLPTNSEIALMRSFNIECDRLYKARGCELCTGIGYKGRSGIFELLMLTQNLRDLISNHASMQALESSAVKEGMQPLIIDAATKLEMGIISLSELQRVLF